MTQPIASRDMASAFKLVIERFGAKVEIHPGGHVVVRTKGNVETVRPDAAAGLTPAAPPAPAPASSTPTETPVIGQRMRDGSVYAGVSPDTGEPMFTTPNDSRLCGSWNDAMDYAARSKAHGHKDWRVPTENELHQLFKHRADIGNFDETGDIGRGWYWSSSQGGINNAWMQRFRHGNRISNLKNLAASLRCVRGLTL